MSEIVPPRHSIRRSEPPARGRPTRLRRSACSTARSAASPPCGATWPPASRPTRTEHIAAQMRACLDARGGEISARNRAAKLAQTYLGLDDAGTARLPAHPRQLRLRPGGRHPRLRRRADGGRCRPSGPAAKAALRRALEPPRLRLLTQFTTIPDGMKFLVDLRANLLRPRKDDPHAGRAGERTLRGLLANWFDVGFLELQRIDWNSPAVLLERLVGYEAVHEIRSWRDLKNRLDCDRRCYAFFHPRMPDEPLIFVEVALVQGPGGQRAAPARREGAAARPASRPTPRSSTRSATASAAWPGSASAIS